MPKTEFLWVKAFGKWTVVLRYDDDPNTFYFCGDDPNTFYFCGNEVDQDLHSVEVGPMVGRPAELIDD